MPSDEELLARLLRGDLAAFDALYERYERHLLGLIRLHLSDAAEAQDVLQDTFLSLIRDCRAGRSASSFKPWIFQVARNLCLNRLRTRRRTTAALDVVARDQLADARDGQPNEAVEAKEATEALRTAVAQLPPGLAEVYRLRAAGLSYEQMAETLKIPLGTIKSRLHEMVSRLKQEVSR